MVGRVSKVLGGLGAGLAVVLAGATGVTWLTNKNANVAHGEVVQQGAAPSAGITQEPVASPAVPQSLDSLSVTAPPPVPMMIHSETWIISSGANVEDFPLEKHPIAVLSCLTKDFPTGEALEDCLGETPGCTPGQRDWLRENALLVHERLNVNDGRLGLGNATLTNTSSSAQSIAFKDIRLEAEFSPFDDAGFRIVCSNYNDWAGGATTGFANSREVILPAGEGTAVFGAPVDYGEDLTRDIPGGMPAVFNLAAGETSSAQLYVQVPYSVGTISGKVHATVSAADGQREMEIPLPLLNAGESAFSPSFMPTLWVDGGTVCPDKAARTKYTTMRTICSLSQLKAEANGG